VYFIVIWIYQIKKYGDHGIKIFHIVINGCQNINMQGVTLSASRKSPDTDGIHVQLSTGVTILNTKNKNTRKFLSIGVDTTNLSIENVACGPVMNKVIKTILYTFLICFLWITKERIEADICKGEEGHG